LEKKKADQLAEKKEELAKQSQHCRTNLCANTSATIVEKKKEPNDDGDEQNGCFNWLGNCCGGDDECTYNNNNGSSSRFKKKKNEEDDDNMQAIHRKRRYWRAAKEATAVAEAESEASKDGIGSANEKEDGDENAAAKAEFEANWNGFSATTTDTTQSESNAFDDIVKDLEEAAKMNSLLENSLIDQSTETEEHRPLFHSSWDKASWDKGDYDATNTAGRAKEAEATRDQSGNDGNVSSGSIKSKGSQHQQQQRPLFNATWDGKPNNSNIANSPSLDASIRSRSAAPSLGESSQYSIVEEKPNNADVNNVNVLVNTSNIELQLDDVNNLLKVIPQSTTLIIHANPSLADAFSTVGSTFSSVVDAGDNTNLVSSNREIDDVDSSHHRVNPEKAGRLPTV